MIDLQVNQLVEFVEEGRRERVLWVDPLARGYFLIDIASPSAAPVFREAGELDQLLANHLAREVADDPWLAPINEATVPPGHRARRDKSWAMIRPLVFEQPAIFTPGKRAKLVLTLVKETGASRHSLYRLLRRYWQRGLRPNALLPDYDKCGGRGKAKDASAKKRGRSTTTGILGINVDAEMRTTFRAVVTRYFAVNRQLDLAGAYQELIREHYTDPVLDEQTGRQKLVVRAEHPTLRQFRYWFEKDNDVFRIERQRRTPRVYDKDMRALLNTSTGEVFGPGSRFQIDATIADVYLVSRYDRNKIVGRPVLYIVIDVFSRMVTGLYVGFEGPSWVGAMMAIANAASDKVAYCRQFGIEITEADWPCHCLPANLLGDRGEVAGEAIETLINNFPVHVETTAPYRADWKGIVEQRFRLLPAKFKPYVPGYVADDYRERGVRDYRLDAKLDIDQFTEIIIHCIRYYNTCHRIEGYERHPQMIADEVTPVPIELWEWGIARRTGKPWSVPEDMLKLSLLPADDATVTAEGIRFFGGYYTCQKAMEEHWFERARQQRRWKVRVSYEPRCMDEIYLHDKGGRTRFIPCALTPRSAWYRGRTLWEIDQIRQEERRQQKAYTPQALQGKVDLTEAIKGVVEKAEAMRAEAPTDPASDRQKVKGIRANRREERRENQEREAFRFGPERDAPPEGGKVVPFPTTPPPADDYSLPSIAEILGQLEGDEDDDDGRRR